MLSRGIRAPRKGLLVDFDYAIDLKPERQEEFKDEAYSNALPIQYHSGDKDSEVKEPEMDKEFARGQRTVSDSLRFFVYSLC